jgi:hypothetical protein
MKIHDLLDALLRFDKDKAVCVGVDGGYRHIEGVTAPDGDAIMIPTIELGAEVDWRFIEGAIRMTTAATAPKKPDTQFDNATLRNHLDDCVRALNNLVVAHVKGGLDMPASVWKTIEAADQLVNSARDAIPTRTVVRYPAWIDVTVDTRAEDDHTIVKSVAMAQQGDAGSFGPNTRPYVTEAEDQDLADAALRFTEDAVWPDPKLEG